eukprot:89397-Chlamydomonas_euryale.AAC.1
MSRPKCEQNASNAQNYVHARIAVRAVRCVPMTVRPVRRTVRYGRYGHPDSGKGWKAISTPEYAYLPWSYTPSPR